MLTRLAVCRHVCQHAAYPTTAILAILAMQCLQFWLCDSCNFGYAMLAILAMRFLQFWLCDSCNFGYAMLAIFAMECLQFSLCDSCNSRIAAVLRPKRFWQCCDRSDFRIAAHTIFAIHMLLKKLQFFNSIYAYIFHVKKMQNRSPQGSNSITLLFAKSLT